MKRINKITKTIYIYNCEICKFDFTEDIFGIDQRCENEHVWRLNSKNPQKFHKHICFGCEGKIRYATKL